MLLLSGNSVQALIDSPNVKPQTESNPSDHSDRTAKRLRRVVIEPVSDSRKQFAHISFGFVIHRYPARPSRLSQAGRLLPAPLEEGHPTPCMGIPNEACARGCIVRLASGDGTEKPLRNDPHGKDPQHRDCQCCGHCRPKPAAAVGAARAHRNPLRYQPTQNSATPQMATRTQQEPVDMVLARTRSILVSDPLRRRSGTTV